MNRSTLEALIDQGLSLEPIAEHAGLHPSTVGYWVRKHGLEAPNRAKHAPRGGLSREQLAPLVEEGMSIREIAARLGVSYTTARHWLRKSDLQTQHRRRVEDVVEARHRGQGVIPGICRRHGPNDFFLERRGYYRCGRCLGERVSRRRRKAKQILVNEAGGACVLCGYDKFVGALQFHHTDPSEKSFQVSSGRSISIARLRDEVRKCVLLCSNCHAEVEGGVTALR